MNFFQKKSGTKSLKFLRGSNLKSKTVQNKIVFVFGKSSSSFQTLSLKQNGVYCFVFVMEWLLFRNQEEAANQTTCVRMTVDNLSETDTLHGISLKDFESKYTLFKLSFHNQS